jgi:hypothetical protein
MKFAPQTTDGRVKIFVLDDFFQGSVYHLTFRFGSRYADCFTYQRIIQHDVCSSHDAPPCLIYTNLRLKGVYGKGLIFSKGFDQDSCIEWPPPHSWV